MAMHQAPTGVFGNEMVEAPDGTLWFSGGFAGSIDMYNPATQATAEYPLPGPGGGDPLGGLAVGPDGNIWFSDDGNNSVGTINLTTHAMTEFPLPTPQAGPTAIIGGPDGNVWFIEYTVNQIGSINLTTHAISEYPIGDADFGWAFGGGITVGPDGNFWFAPVSVAQVGPEGGGEAIEIFNLTTDTYTVYTIPDLNQVNNITTGPDGNLWLTMQIWNPSSPDESTGGWMIGKLDPTTGALTEIPLSATTTYWGIPWPFDITTGPDGNIWFADTGSDAIGMIDPTTDALTEYPVPGDEPDVQGPQGPYCLTAGPGDTIWFWANEGQDYQLGELDLNPPATGTTGSGGDPGSGTGPPASSPPDSGSSTGTGNGTGSDTGQAPTTPPAYGSSTGSGGSADGTASSPGAAAPVTTGSSTGTSDAGPTSTPAPETPTVASPSTGASALAGGSAPVLPPAAEIPPVPGDRYSFAIGLTRGSVPDAAGHAGAISLTLGSKPRRDVLAVATGKGRVAVSGLTLHRFDHGAGFRIFADVNARIMTTRDTRTAAVPHLLATEKVLTAGKGKDRHVDGFRVVLAEAFAPAVVRGMAHRDAVAIPDGGRPGLVDLEVSYLTSLGAGSLDLHARARVAPTGQVIVIART